MPGTPGSLRPGPSTWTSHRLLSLGPDLLVSLGNGASEEERQYLTSLSQDWAGARGARGPAVEGGSHLRVGPRPDADAQLDRPWDGHWVWHKVGL